MHESVLRAWEGFYVIVGTSAGALTGLQFVVLALISEAGMVRGSGAALAAFASPNVVHFCAALLISGIASAPWHDPGPPGAAFALTGAIGIAYSVAVLRRARRQTEYRPVLEDWIWHAALPILAYAALMLAGVQLSADSASAPFVAGGVTLLLVFIGIHNAWDTVFYAMVERTREARTSAEAAKRAPIPENVPHSGEHAPQSHAPPPP